MKTKIWLSPPHMGGKELQFVQEAFESNWIAPIGPAIDGFENDLKRFLRQDVHVAALSSGTAALHLALLLAGVQPGDDVICQSMTFIASANPILYVNANPVFVDSEPDTWNMHSGLLREAIQDRLSKGRKPKAIIVTHLYGMPARMDEISVIAEEFAIPIIEDAAEALGSSINGERCGTMGVFSIFSFNGNKIITTSGGGALISNSEDDIKMARFLATQARDPSPHYEHTRIGFNYRLSNVSASIGRGQMKVLDARIQERRANFLFYKSHLESIPGVTFQEERENYFSNRWLTTILIDEKKLGGRTRDLLTDLFQNENIETRPLWKPMHMQPVFKGAQAYINGVSESLFRQGICLPSGSNITFDEKARILEVLGMFFSGK